MFMGLWKWCQRVFGFNSNNCLPIKKNIVLIKDEFDEQFAFMLEYGIVSFENYEKTKKFYFSEGSHKKVSDED